MTTKKNTLLDRIRTCNKATLEDILKDIQLYQECRKVSRSRAIDLFDHKKTGSLVKKIQHFGPVTGQRAALKKLYTNVFQESADGIVFQRRDDLDGGVRMFHGDDMAELSLRDFEQRILNIT